MLDLCVQGMGDVELTKFYAYKMKVAPCMACFSCWRQTPGECAQKDDFAPVLEAYKGAQYVLVAAPLYVWGFPGPVKTMIDRFIPVIEPWMIPGEDGVTRHPRRYELSPKAVLISSCGFPEMKHFDLMRAHFKLMCDNSGWTWAGEILIPGAAVYGIPGVFDFKHDAIRSAGRELVSGVISPETTAEIAKNVLSAEDSRNLVNGYFEGGIKGKAKMAAVAVKARIRRG